MKFQPYENVTGRLTPIKTAKIRFEATGQVVREISRAWIQSRCRYSVIATA